MLKLFLESLWANVFGEYLGQSGENWPPGETAWNCESIPFHLHGMVPGSTGLALEAVKRSGLALQLGFPGGPSGDLGEWQDVAITTWNRTVCRLPSLNVGNQMISNDYSATYFILFHTFKLGRLGTRTKKPSLSWTFYIVPWVLWFSKTWLYQ